MNKTKILIKNIGKYLRELSVIVVGIAITVISGLWINNRNNEKDIDLYLENIKMELQDNLESVAVVKNYYDRAAHYSEYLLANKLQNLHPDTMSMYIDLVPNLTFFTYKTSAFDMLKTSGLMRLIKDKNKVMAIWNCYDELELFKITNEFYRQRKVAVIENLNGFAQGNLEQEALIGFYTNGMAESWAKMCDACSKHIEETIARL